MAEPVFRLMFDAALRERADAITGGPVTHLSDLDGAASTGLVDVEVLITGWGCPPLDSRVLAAAPRLRAIFHTGGSVKAHVTEACWDRGLVVTSAAAANAVFVAEYAVGAILLALKRVPTYAVLFRDHPGQWEWRDQVPAPRRARRAVGLVGFSRIGRIVAERLRPFDLDVVVADPYADAGQVAALGARLADLDEIVVASDVLSLHAPATDETRHLLDHRRLAVLPDGATVINTARGSLVDTAALTEHCVRGRLSAVLDVTEPEPLPADSPLYRLPNVTLTPHVAGAMGAETHRLAALALDELDRFVRGGRLRHQVFRDDLARLA
jgi:phosphoglycerate dehydrogenase-like enzyme